MTAAKFLNSSHLHGDASHIHAFENAGHCTVEASLEEMLKKPVVGDDEDDIEVNWLANYYKDRLGVDYRAQY